jgi:hypothetical protein
MKMNNLKLALTAAFLGLASGCSQKEESTAPSAADVQRASVTITGPVQKAVSVVEQTAGEAAQKATAEAETLKARVRETTQEATAQATAQATAEVSSQQDKVKAQAQGLIDQASKLVAESRYTEAAASLKQLANYQLTSEQQKVVDTLKITIQKAVAKDATSGAAKTVDDLLGGKK